MQKKTNAVTEMQIHDRKTFRGETTAKASLRIRSPTTRRQGKRENTRFQKTTYWLDPSFTSNVNRKWRISRSEKRLSGHFSSMSQKDLRAKNMNFSHPIVSIIGLLTNKEIWHAIHDMQSYMSISATQRNTRKHSSIQKILSRRPNHHPAQQTLVL